MSTLKPLEEIIRENVFCLGGNRDHVPACLCYMLYCVANSERFNLAYFMAKRMEWVTKQARLILPYGMLLTRLLDFIIGENPELQNESYVLYDRVMNPLAAQLEQPRRDRGTRRGRHSTSLSSAFELYCIKTSTRYNLAFFVLERMEKTRSKPKELLPYGMLLTRLFKHVVSVFTELAIDRYISHDRVMPPLAPHYERKTRSDHDKKRPRKSNASSSFTTLNHPSSSHPLDDPLMKMMMNLLILILLLHLKTSLLVK
ncbi:hypothetical protein Tco_0374986 [Tanacetum coccineum]